MSAGEKSPNSGDETIAGIDGALVRKIIEIHRSELSLGRCGECGGWVCLDPESPWCDAVRVQSTLSSSAGSVVCIDCLRDYFEDRLKTRPHGTNSLYISVAEWYCKRRQAGYADQSLQSRWEAVRHEIPGLGCLIAEMGDRWDHG